MGRGAGLGRTCMLRIALLISFVFAMASTGCGDGDKKPPMTPDSDKPAELADSGVTTSPPPAK
jgi:hypothetical protein